jgi:hypothetical protein
MRSIKRFLVLGTVVFVGLLLSGSRPATPVQPSTQMGNFRGEYSFSITSKTHEFHEDSLGSTFLDDVEIDWAGAGTIDLAIPQDLQSTAALRSERVTIFQYADATMTGSGHNCSWEDALTARGKFGNSWTFFNRSAATWDTSVIWNKITSYVIKKATSSGDIKGCEQFGSRLANAQKVKAVEAVTRTIDLFRFTITSFSDFQISGNCSLPNWEGTFPTAYGNAQHINKGCDWQVFRKESQEWKNPLLRGQ